MFPSRSTQSRYIQTARRSHLARVVALGALAMVPVACSSGTDAGAFSASSNTIVAASDTAAATTTDGATPTTAANATTPTTAAPSATTSASSVATFPTGGEMVVDFTFSATGGGQVHNPYVAVWVEDTDGNLVQTISLWYQAGRGEKYLNDLRGWVSASGGTLDASTSGATRTAGTYSVAWDGTDANGDAVAQGDYVLFVEAARERGPYEITNTPITISDQGFTVTLADSGELTNLSATLTA